MARRISCPSITRRLLYTNPSHSRSFSSALRHSQSGDLRPWSDRPRTLDAFNARNPPYDEDWGSYDWLWEPERDGDYFCRDADAEPLNLYREGGYHPVHLRDKVQDGRYEIFDKLGWGRDGTVWLARDET